MPEGTTSTFDGKVSCQASQEVVQQDCHHSEPCVCLIVFLTTIAISSSLQIDRVVTLSPFDLHKTAHWRLDMTGQDDAIITDRSMHALA